MKKDYITQFVIAAFVTLIVVAFISPRVHAQVLRIFTPSQGGTGIGTATGGDVGKCLKVLSDSPFTYELGACGTGGGGGSGTDTLFNWNSTTNIISTDGASTTATTSFSTNGFTANTATITAATTTNFFSSILTATNGIIASLLGTNATVTNATSTKVFSTTGTFGSLFFTDGVGTNATTTRFYSSSLGLNNEYFTDLTGTGLQNSAGVLTLNATGDWTGTLDGFEGTTLAQTNWLFNGTRLTPSTTVGIGVFASSTISDLSVTNGTTTNATSTRLYTGLFGLNSEYFSDLTGTGLQNSGGVLTLNATGDWTGTFDGYEATSLLNGSNWLFNGTRLTPSSTVGIVVLSSSTISDLNSARSTSTSATSTNLFASIFNATSGFISSLLGTNATITNATTTNLAATSFKIGSDVITDITGTNLSVANGVLSATASGGSNWLFDGTRLTPSTTAGISVNASSSIFALNVVNGTTTNATSTRLYTGLFGLNSEYFSDLTGFGLANTNGSLGLLTTGAADGECLTYSSTGPTIDWITCASGGGGSGGGWATTTGDNAESGETISYTNNDALIGGTSPATAEFNFDPETSRFTISSTSVATGTIDSVLNAIRLGSTTREQVEFNWNNTDTLRLLTSTGVSLFDFGSISISATSATTTNFFTTNASTSNFWGAGLSGCSGSNKVTWSAGKFGCETDQTGAGGGSSNWLFNGTRLTPSTTVGIGVFASSTISDLSMTNATATNATTTNLRTTQLGVGSDYLTDITGTGLQISGSALTLNATGDWTGTLDGYEGATLAQTNWLFDGTRLTPSSTVGVVVNASSSIDFLSMRNATATNATSTTLFSALGTFTNMIVNTLATFFNVVVTGLLDVGGGVLEIPNGTNPTVDSVGELAYDTTDDQLLIADSGGTARVIGTEEFRVVSLTMSSTSPRFTSGQTLPVLGFKDGLEITQYRCYVVGGTSKVVNLTDGTNDTETIACNTTISSDSDVATNDIFTADELGYLEMGATTGVVDYLHFEAWARITRE